jgi:hypothetical protein
MMIKSAKLYLKRKDIPIESLLDLAHDAGSGWANAQVVAGYRPDLRSTQIKKGLNHREYVDICKYLLDMINVWDNSLDPNDYIVGEFNYLKYSKGDHFTKHKDKLNQKNEKNNERIFSTSTIISKTDDLKGGEFLIYDRLGNRFDVPLDVGETIFFDSSTQHQVNEVTSGVREVLVAWIWKKQT